MREKIGRATSRFDFLSWKIKRRASCQSRREARTANLSFAESVGTGQGAFARARAPVSQSETIFDHAACHSCSSERKRPVDWSNSIARADRKSTRLNSSHVEIS